MGRRKEFEQQRKAVRGKSPPVEETSIWAWRGANITSPCGYRGKGKARPGVRAEGFRKEENKIKAKSLREPREVGRERKESKRGEGRHLGKLGCGKESPVRKRRGAV